MQHNTTSQAQRSASTIRQFCDEHQIGRTTLYALLKVGQGPRLMKVGKKTLISTEAAAEWRRRMENETAQHAEA